MGKIISFYDKKELREINKPAKTVIDLDINCMKCGLAKKCRSPKLDVSGEGRLNALFLAEGSGCVSGDTFIETAFRNKLKSPKGIKIKNLVGKKNFYVYSFDIEKNKLVLGKVNKVWKTGRKKVYKVTYEWFYYDIKKRKRVRKTNSIKVSSNHPFLLKHSLKGFRDPYLGIKEDVDYLSIDQGLKEGHSIHPFCRYHDGQYNHVGAFSSKTKKESRFLLEYKIGRKLKRDEQCHHDDENKQNDNFKNLKLMNLNEHSRHHTNNSLFCDKAIKNHRKSIRSKAYREKMSNITKEVLKDPKVKAARLKQLKEASAKYADTLKTKLNTEPEFYWNFLYVRRNQYKLSYNDRVRKFKEKFPNSEIPDNNHKIVSIEYIGVQDVYDIEVDKYNNFAAHDIFLHNSEEDKSGIQLVGAVGQFFRQKLKDRGYSLEKDFYKVNAVQCRPTKTSDSGNTVNRTPTSEEINYCRPRFLKIIEELKPRFIIPMGNVAMECLLGGIFKELNITLWRGLCIPDRELNAYIMPLFHPSRAYRDETDKNFMSQYDRDLDNVLKTINAVEPDVIDSVTIDYEDHKIPYKDESEDVTCLYDFNDVCHALEFIIKEKPDRLIIDYETNCLKPYIRGSKIASISIGWGGTAWSFPYQYREHFNVEELNHITKFYKKILGRMGTILVSQNVHMELNWSRVKFNAPVKPWQKDTMLATHVIDNRRNFTSLNMQAYVNFGVRPYDTHISPFLKSKGKNPFNNIMECDLQDLLLYGGLDNIYTQKLDGRQEQFFKTHKKLHNAYKFFHEGTLTCSKLSYNGVHVDEQYYHNTWQKLDNKIERTENAILNCDEAKRFKKTMGRPLSIKKEVSSKDLRKLLFDIDGHSPTGFTSKALLESTDVDALSKIQTPLTRMVLKRRKYVKLLGYIEQYIRECHDGMIHADFPLHIPLSYRGSSAKPNLTNVPKRDKEGQKLVRSGIMPSKGNRIGEIDFSGMEVATGCCYHKDPQMIKYLTDPKADMHRDAAKDIWMLPAKEITKDIRFYAKNDWTFAQFYGSYYGNCAKSLWEDCIKTNRLKTTSGLPLRQHLRDNGITKYYTFEEHAQEVEKKFWNRLKVYKQWKYDMNDFYIKNGYIETYFGFRFTGPMTFNEISNYPVQGTAFHILLWTLNEVLKIAEAEKWLSRVLMQIHDASVWDLVKNEIRHILKTINYIATIKTRETFQWINVPLKLEAELAPVDRSWAEVREVKLPKV